MKICNCKLPESMIDRFHVTQVMEHEWCKFCGYLALDYNKKTHGELVPLQSKFKPVRKTQYERFVEKRNHFIDLFYKGLTPDEIGRKTGNLGSKVSHYLALTGEYKRHRRSLTPIALDTYYKQFKKNRKFIMSNIDKLPLNMLASKLGLKPRTVRKIVLFQPPYAKHKARFEREEQNESDNR